jgi:peptide/nickel transport system substrate-binding protein
VQGDHLTFVRKPDYWQPGKPYLDQVTLRVLADQQSALVARESGYLDWANEMAGQDARRLQADPSYHVLPTGSHSLPLPRLTTSNSKASCTT